jgi:hypothetical protein
MLLPGGHTAAGEHHLPSGLFLSSDAVFAFLLALSTFSVPPFVCCDRFLATTACWVWRTGLERASNPHCRLNQCGEGRDAIGSSKAAHEVRGDMLGVSPALRGSSTLSAAVCRLQACKQ